MPASQYRIYDEVIVLPFAGLCKLTNLAFSFATDLHRLTLIFKTFIRKNL